MEAEFDIEKWRIDNPMDYLKAVEFIISSPIKNEAFKTLYDITRLHIPRLLYKFYCLTNDEELNNKKIETLRYQRIYLADSKTFNDPFENKAFFYRNEVLKQFEILRVHKGRICDEIFYNSRSAALTRSGVDSMPMWAHYANNHQGFCVSYDMSLTENMHFSSCTFPIQYIDKRIDITDIMVNQIAMILDEIEMQIKAGRKKIIINDLTLGYIIPLLQNIKQSEWSYEQEFRCTAGNLPIDQPFMSAIPFSIYVGKNCSQLHTDKLSEISFELKMPLYIMKFNEFDSKYKFIPQKLN